MTLVIPFPHLVSQHQQNANETKQTHHKNENEARGNLGGITSLGN